MPDRRLVRAARSTPGCSNATATWYVEDLGSTNGTYLNRSRVAGPMVVKRRDRLQIGNTVLEMV